MKNLYLPALMLSCIALCSCKNASATENNSVNTSTGQQTEALHENSASQNNDPGYTSQANTKIQVAILLDTSSSMDGLIDQAKSRLWNIVNTLTTLRFKGKTPEIQIALYEYGNDKIKASDGYVRLVTPLTTDLDLISEKLFALKTDGGSEYCGTVIDKAGKELKWSTNASDIRLIYIAGNEPFTQGNISYKEAIGDVLRKNITVNTIHCGDRNQGIKGEWKAGADKGNGKFFNIDHNAQVRYVATPYDDRIDQCNVRLNATYVSYGSVGKEKKMSQAQQDKNAESISYANKAERIVSKTKAVYKNESWDMVDLAAENEDALKDIRQSELPSELQGKTETEIKSYIAQKTEERTSIQKEIEQLAKQRQAYIDDELKKSNNSSEDDLGMLINQSVIEFATAKGYDME